MIGFQIDESALGVCRGLRFPGESRLTVAQTHKRLSRSHMEYSVVHSRDRGILLTPSRFGELQDSLTAILTVFLPSLSYHCHCQLEDKFQIFLVFHGQEKSCERVRRDG